MSFVMLSLCVSVAKHSCIYHRQQRRLFSSRLAFCNPDVTPYLITWNEQH